MANPEHLAKLKEGVKPWGQWREQNVGVWPDLRDAEPLRSDLLEEDLFRWDLSEADVSETNLSKAYLSGADLRTAGNFRRTHAAGFHSTCLGSVLTIKEAWDTVVKANPLY